MNKKQCIYCEQIKPADEFYVARKVLSPRCRKCHGLAERECRNCGGDFIGKVTQVLCGEKCKKEARPVSSFNCGFCGVLFDADRLSQQYCSTECWAHQKKGDPSPLKGRVRPSLVRAEERNCATCNSEFRAVKDFGYYKQEYCSHGCYLKNRRVSIPENMAGEYFKSLNIPFTPQFKLGRMSIDFKLDGAPLAVEVDGAYWHSQPLVIERDKRKNKILEKMGIELHRVDAEDVRSNPEKALKVITTRWQEYTGRQAILEGDGRTFDEVKAERLSV